jgi:RimJ/RimL family protein N-acetyltransferase
MTLRLTTPRLTIEPLADRDVTDFVAYRQDPEVARYQGWATSYSAGDARALVAAQPVDGLPDPGGWLQLAVRSRDGRLLGDVAVHTLDDEPDSFELGATFARSEQGSGFATEAVRAVLTHLFTVAKAHRVIAVCDARNEPVARLLRRVGLRQESSQVEADWFKGEWTTLDGYAILAREWAATEQDRAGAQES